MISDVFESAKSVNSKLTTIYDSGALCQRALWTDTSLVKQIRSLYSISSSLVYVTNVVRIDAVVDELIRR